MSRRQSMPPQPTTVNEAVFTLLAELSGDHFEGLKATERPYLERHYIGLARFIRNIFGLHGDNPRLLSNTGADNPYDASMVILEALWRYLAQGKKQR
jgi:hypothetical protein